MLWFTADTHFFHRNIIKYCNRPFDDVEAMNEALIRNWNEVVDEYDRVFVIGDFAMSATQLQIDRLLARLKGHKTLIAGNHDGARIKRSTGWVRVLREAFLKQDDVRMHLYHYPIESWNGMYKGAIHLHGHSHGTSNMRVGRVDVGVDCQNYRPVSFPSVLAQART